MLTVFYGNQVYGEYTSWKELYAEINPNMDAYHAAYIYHNHPLITAWYRCDGTPVLIEDVPAICKAWLLIL